MRANKKRTGLSTASQTVFGLIALLLAMVLVSGGFVGLPGLAESLAYSVAIMIPLLLVVFLANRMANGQPERVALTAPIRDKTLSQN